MTNEEAGIVGWIPKDAPNYDPYDIFRRLTPAEKREQREQIKKTTVKFATGLDDKVLPKMPTNKNASVVAQRQFLGIIAARQARLQAQIDWLRAERERNRQ